MIITGGHALLRLIRIFSIEFLCICVVINYIQEACLSSCLKFSDVVITNALLVEYP